MSIKEAIWARNDDDGKWVTVSNGVFRRGEVVNLILRAVGKFIPANDGKHWFDMDMIVKSPSGQIVLDQRGLLGEKGHLMLKDGIAESPYDIFKTKVEMEPGLYEMTVTVHDKINGAKVSISKSFTLSGGLSYQEAVFAKKGIDGKMSQVEDRIFQRGEEVNFILLHVGMFKKGPEGKHRFDIDMEVNGPDGKVAFAQKDMLGENGHLALEGDIAESPFGIFSSVIDMDPGTYVMQLTIRDRIGNEKLTVTKPFTLK